MIVDEKQKTFLTGCVIAISDNFIESIFALIPFTYLIYFFRRF